MVNTCDVTKVICRHVARGPSTVRSEYFLCSEMISKVDSVKVQNSCVGSFKPMEGDMKLQKGSLKWRHNLAHLTFGAHAA